MTHDGRGDMAAGVKAQKGAESEMTDMEVIESLDNAWRALARQYEKYPDEGIRCGMNLLAKIIREAKAEVEESHRENQITIEEWIAMLQEGKGIWKD